MTQLNIQGNLFDPQEMGESAYEQVLMSTLFNQRTLTQRPDLMVQPKTIEDVVQTIGFAQATGKKISICSGGHSWSANHMRDDSVLIDMHFFNQFEIDQETGTAIAGPATDGSTFLKGAMRQGFFFPVGHCKGVCIGGYLLQGGLGGTGANWGWRVRMCLASIL